MITKDYYINTSLLTDDGEEIEVQMLKSSYDRIYGTDEEREARRINHPLSSYHMFILDLTNENENKRSQ